MLQCYWAIVWHPVRTWKVMITCVIIQNMVLEDERDEEFMTKSETFRAIFQELLHVHHQIHDRLTHIEL